MGLTKPTENGSSGVWDTLLNDLIDIIDAHDHTSGSGVLVASAALNIDAAVAWGGYNLTNMGEIGFATTTTGTVAKGLRVVANELTWRNSGGVDVTLTNGTSLNTTLVGGITGDYSSTDADCEYDDATKAYEMKQDESPDHFAKVKCADLHLYEATSGITSFVTVKSPGSLAASYSVTMPTALPVSGTRLVTLTSAGVMSHTLTPTVTTLETTGNLTIGGDINTTGDVQGGTLTSDADVKHGSLTKQLHASEGNGSFSGISATTGRQSGGAENWFLRIPFDVGDVIESVRFVYDRGGNNITFALERQGIAGGASVSIDSGTDTAAATWATTTLNGGSLPYTIAADNFLYVFMTTAGAGTLFMGVTVVYSRA